MRSKLQLACGLSVAAVLTACGGSGSVEPPPPPPTPKLTSEQIHQYSVNSAISGLILPGPSTVVAALALSYAESSHEPVIPCDNEGGTVAAEYIDSDHNESVSVGDRVNFTFTQCQIFSLGFALTDDEDGALTFDGKASAVITDYAPLLNRVVAAPAKATKASKFLKSLKDDADAGTAAHLGAKVTHDQLQVLQDDDDADNGNVELKGTMGLRFSLVFPADTYLKAQGKPAPAPAFTIAASQETGESLTISFRENGKDYAQTITEYQSEDNILCGYFDECAPPADATADAADTPDTDDADDLQHSFSTLQFANQGSDPELGTFNYRVRLGAPLVPFSSGTVLTETRGETITTVFSASGDVDTVDIRSTGGATWTGDFETYID